MADTYAASDALVRRIANDRGASDAEWFLDLKRAAQAWKPDGYDTDQIERRHYYEGKIEQCLRTHMRKRFRLTADHMPLVDSNWAWLVAVNGAAVYDYPPTRHLERDGDKIDPDAEPVEGEPAQAPDDIKRAEDFAQMLKEAHLETVMAEAERRTVLAKTSFLKIHSDALTSIATGKPPVTKVTSFWPCDVLVIPHPSNPAELATAVCVMLRVAGENGCADGSTTWEVWTRDYQEDESGNVLAFGPWSADKVVEQTVKVRVGTSDQWETKVKITPIIWRTVAGASTDVYPCKTLPIVEWHAGVAQGSPFLDQGRNLINTFNNINADRSSEKFAVDMNAATPIIRKTDEPQPRDIALGPGMLTSVRVGDDIVPVPVTADFAGIRAAAQAGLDEMALEQRQAPSSYNAEMGGAPSTGIALQIKNEPQTKARIEAMARAIEVESRLLAVMAEVHDYWRGTSIVDDGITFCMVPQDPPSYESSAEVAKEAIDLETAGLISRAEARVRIGASRTIEDAKLALERIDAERKARGPSPLGQALNALAMPFGQQAQQPPPPPFPPKQPPEVPPTDPPAA
jgi:hypothetical protein